MLKRTGVFASFMLLGMVTSACGATPGSINQAVEKRPAATIATGKTMTNQDIPLNRRFATLEAYLSHLEHAQGPVDGPWYKETSPGVYELQTGNLQLDGPSAEKRTFTRKELKKKFGFSK